MDDSNDSDCELVIDETILISDDEEKTQGLAEAGDDWNLFHPVSISSSDMKEELFTDETYTCTICNETFRYNIGLIYHVQVEHELIQSKVSGKEAKPKKRKTIVSKVVCKKSEPLIKKFTCDVCKKPFVDQSKLLKHSETCSMKFSCVLCKSKFSWESKYKKHLYKIHKFNAVVICKLCSSVFGDMSALAQHSLSCGAKSSLEATVTHLSQLS